SSLRSCDPGELWLASGLFLAAFGCSQAHTEIWVVADSDLKVPMDLARVDFAIERGVDAQTKSGDMTDPTAPRLPLVQRILYHGGALGPIDIVVEGHGADGSL